MRKTQRILPTPEKTVNAGLPHRAARLLDLSLVVKHRSRRIVTDKSDFCVTHVTAFISCNLVHFARSRKAFYHGLILGGQKIQTSRRENIMAHLTHLYEPGLTYLLTSVTRQRQPLFADPCCAQAAFDDLIFYTRKFKAASLAQVVMPNHVHWVIYPSPEDFRRFVREEQARSGKYSGHPERFYLSKIMEDYKRHVGFTINEYRGSRRVRVWQDGFRDDGLRTLAVIRKVVRYVVFNPVRAGLVAKPEVYPYLAWDPDWLV